MKKFFLPKYNCKINFMLTSDAINYIYAGSDNRLPFNTLVMYK